jgi:hypothetical protein
MKDAIKYEWNRLRAFVRRLNPWWQQRRYDDCICTLMEVGIELNNERNRRIYAERALAAKEPHNAR